MIETCVRFSSKAGHYSRRDDPNAQSGLIVVAPAGRGGCSFFVPDLAFELSAAGRDKTVSSSGAVEEDSILAKSAGVRIHWLSRPAESCRILRSRNLREGMAGFHGIAPASRPLRRRTNISTKRREPRAFPIFAVAKPAFLGGRVASDQMHKRAQAMTCLSNLFPLETPASFWDRPTHKNGRQNLGVRTNG